MLFYSRYFLVFSFTILSCLASPFNENYWQKDNGLTEKRLSVVISGNDWIDNIYLFRCVAGNLQLTVASNAIAPQNYLKTEW